jgi:type I restriction enzyme S subunit
MIKRYEAYKKDELGEIPAHWNLLRLKELSSIQNSNVDKKSYEGEKSIQLCNYVDVYKNEFIDSTLNFMWATADESEIKKFTVKKHDVFITKDSETSDDIAIPALAKESLDDVICGYHLAQIRTKKKLLLGAYLFRLFQSKDYGFRFVIFAKGITRVGLGQSAIADALTPVPPLQEQQAIAAYLDTKTSQIDRKIDLLTQKATSYAKLKQSLINETVTRGLDKSVPMKDSGVEWLGEIPAHWKVKHFKQFSTMKGRIGWQGLKHSEFIDEGAFLITGMNFKGGKINWNEVYHIAEERYEQAPEIQLRADDILMTKDGTIGKLLFIESIPFPYKASLNSHLLVFRPIKNSFYPKYLYYQLDSSAFQNYTEIAKAGTTFFGISQAAVGRYIAFLPTFAEQKAIAEYLDTKTSYIDRIIETINTQVEKLKELRKTLINDVVTGKIKITQELNS